MIRMDGKSVKNSTCRVVAMRVAILVEVQEGLLVGG